MAGIFQAGAVESFRLPCVAVGNRALEADERKAVRAILAVSLLLGGIPGSPLPDRSAVKRQRESFVETTRVRPVPLFLTAEKEPALVEQLTAKARAWTDTLPKHYEHGEAKLD
jgi:hypothetical protein